jgi:hypothetical protein
MGPVGGQRAVLAVHRHGSMNVANRWPSLTYTVHADGKEMGEWRAHDEQITCAHDGSNGDTQLYGRKRKEGLGEAE